MSQVPALFLNVDLWCVCVVLRCDAASKGFYTGLFDCQKEDINYSEGYFYCCIMRFEDSLSIIYQQIH